MKLRRWSYGLILLATILIFASVLTLRSELRRWQAQPMARHSIIVDTLQPVTGQATAPTAFPTPQVVMGTPEFYDKPINSRYIYRNEFPADRTKRLPLYLIDTETGVETRLGDDSRAAVFGTMNDEYLLWFLFDDGLHAYHLATSEDKLIAERVSSSLHPQIADDWVIFGKFNGNGGTQATLYTANLRTGEQITLTQKLSASAGIINEQFGISPYLAAWKESYQTIVIYDLSTRREIIRLTDIEAVFNKQYLTIFDLSPGETVVTWSSTYGYDLVTQSYFRTKGKKPADWGEGLIHDASRIQEKNRVLTWTYTMKDGTQRHVRAPLLDATPSTELCAAGQNLVQNGDLEATADHAFWQQTDSPSNLIVDELPAGLATSGDWAIRLGRYANSHAAIRQPLELPSGVSGLTLAFDVRALSWDFWGGDRLLVDLIDPLTGNSLLATPVQWTNVELASGDWLPMQVAIESWPGINTPVELVFQVQTNWALPTDFVIDNITLTTACTED